MRYKEDDQPEWLLKLQDEIKNFNLQFSGMITEGLTSQSFGITDDFFSDKSEASLYILESGELEVECNEQTVYIIEPGDLFGLHRLSNVPAPLVRSNSIIRYFSLPEDKIKILQNHAQWAGYLLMVFQFFYARCTLPMRYSEQSKSRFVQFEQGEIIIQEGELAEDVYDMLRCFGKRRESGRDS
jgi:CRP-like cAMP-binding protein